MRTLLTGVITLGMFAGVGIASASTIVLSPSTVSVTKGQTFEVLINVDPAGAKVYTVKGIVTYPADILEATSFAFAAGTPMWIPLSQSGYDSMTAGNVTKTAGFPGGFTMTKSLGTITFRAKESGTATIAASPQSLAYDAQSKNTISGAQGSSVVTISVPVVPAPAPKPKTAAKPAVTSPVVATTASTTAATTTAAAADANLAAVAGAGTDFSPWIIGGLVALIVAGVGSWLIYRRQTGL